MNKIETVLSLFNQGFNCAQALLVTYGAGLGLERDTALKIASTFGGGMGRMGETCGTVIGALMIIGLKYGITEPGLARKMEANEFVEKFAKEFKARNSSHSIVCSELLGFHMSPERDLNLNERNIIKAKCPQYVQDAAEIIEKILGYPEESACKKL